MATFQRPNTFVAGILCLLLIIIWPGGCTQKKDLQKTQDPFYEEWRAKAEDWDCQSDCFET